MISIANESAPSGSGADRSWDCIRVVPCFDEQVEDQALWFGIVSYEIVTVCWHWYSRESLNRCLFEKLQWRRAFTTKVIAEAWIKLGTLDKCHRLQGTIKQQVADSVNRIWVASFIKNQISEEQTWRETGREDGKLQPEELAVLLQRLEKMELQHRKELEEWKTLKQIQETRTMLEQNKEMDKSQQHCWPLKKVR